MVRRTKTETSASILVQSVQNETRYNPKYHDCLLLFIIFTFKNSNYIFVV